MATLTNPQPRRGSAGEPEEAGQAQRPPKLTPEAFQELARQIRARSPRSNGPDAAELIREGRSERTAALLGEDPETFDLYEPDFKKRKK